MKDIAQLRDKRGVVIQKVGIKDLHIPLQIRRKENGYQQVLGNVDMAVELPHGYRGTHLSRMVEIIFKWSRQPLGGKDIRAILMQMRKRLDAEHAHITVRFKYFIEKVAPVSKSRSALDYGCEFTGVHSDEGFDFILGVEVPVTSLCPCSKEISERGAHNQRAMIRARIRYEQDVFYWIEDLVEQLEQLPSSDIFPMLKRADEKYVTEKAYDNPKFVEDILRDAVVMFRGNPAIRWFEIEIESLESIHNHSAYAYQQEWLEKDP